MVTSSKSDLTKSGFLVIPEYCRESFSIHLLMKPFSISVPLIEDVLAALSITCTHQYNIRLRHNNPQYHVFTFAKHNIRKAKRLPTFRNIISH